MREDFNAEHGQHIPEDICLCIENPPTRWNVVPREGDMRETLPEVDSDLLAQVSHGTLVLPQLLSFVTFAGKGEVSRSRCIVSRY